MNLRSITTAIATSVALLATTTAPAAWTAQLDGVYRTS